MVLEADIVQAKTVSVSYHSLPIDDFCFFVSRSLFRVFLFIFVASFFLLGSNEPSNFVDVGVVMVVNKERSLRFNHDSVG